MTDVSQGTGELGLGSWDLRAFRAIVAMRTSPFEGYWRAVERGGLSGLVYAGQSLIALDEQSHKRTPAGPALGEN